MKYLYLAPGGFTLPYTLGICQFIKEHYYLNDYKFIGSSAGSWLSVYLASDILYFENLVKDYSKLFEDKDIIYKWNNVCPFLIEEFTELINDTSFIEKKRVKVCLSGIKSNKISNYIIDDYDSLEELLNLCYISSYIPLLSGTALKKRKEMIVFDGYFTEPQFTNKINFEIKNDMFNRKFTLSDFFGKSDLSEKYLIKLGYYDSMINKRILDQHFRSKF